MQWTYSQHTGLLRNDGGAIVGAGYSGLNEGRMNPVLEGVHGIGPIPIGRYTLGRATNHPRLGPLAIPLIPQPETNTLGRSEFFIHGDSAKHPGLASEGCIILALVYRQQLASLVNTLLVVR